MPGMQGSMLEHQTPKISRTTDDRQWAGHIVPLGDEGVYLPLCEVADTPLFLQGRDIYFTDFTATPCTATRNTE